MKTTFTIVVEHDADTFLDDYVSPIYYLLDVYQGMADVHIVMATAVEDDGIDPYDGDPCNEVADLATEFTITKVDECRWLKEDFVWAEIDFNGRGIVSAEGPISWVLPILRAAHGGAAIG
jgi:hypothetical protein